MADEPSIPASDTFEAHSASSMPYGADTIVIPFTWSAPVIHRRPWRRFGGYRWGNAAYPLNQLSRRDGVGDRLFPVALGDSAPQDVHRNTEVAKIAAVNSDSEARSVLLTDDVGKQILTPQGPLKGKPMQRPAGLDPHFFVQQGIRDRENEQTLMNPLFSFLDGGSGAEVAVLHRFEQLRKFNQEGVWDAQRIHGKFHPEYVDYATVAIGLYAAAAGIPRAEILDIENTLAATMSHYGSRERMDNIYTHLPYRNVANTNLGYELYLSGRVEAGHH